MPFLLPAQTRLSCGSDDMMQARPELRARQQQLEDFQLKKQPSPLASRPVNAPFVLPVVVHIVHQNGAENLDDARVLAAVQHLNEAFAHSGYFAQLGGGTNTQIQFCLARRTPDGLLTNGITRTVSALTDMTKETDDQKLKDLIRWPTTDYINVWVVGSINSQSQGSGVAGYAYLASSHGQPYDGLVCEAEYFGADAAQDGVLIHEMGHYLNLYHTFEGGCPNADCQTAGDRVCDTPPDQATHTACPYNSCSTDANDPSPNNPLSADVDDATENFMDYSPFNCYRTFSNGQAARMQFAIENFRKSLLESEGCKDPCTTPIAAAFAASAPTVWAGGTLTFTNQTVGATSYQWFVNGNLVGTGTDLTHQFLGAGNAAVTLRALGSDPNCVGEATFDILVKCGVDAAFSVNSTVLTVGQTLVCTNNTTTTGGPASYVWLINGVNFGSAPDLSQVLGTPGFYTVILQAADAFCSDEASRLIEVKLPAPGAEICDNDLDDDHDGYLDCFDGDCQCFDGADCRADSLFAATPISAKIGWGSPTNWAGINNTPIVANLDPQNSDIPEIIVAEGISNNLAESTVTKLLIFQGDGSNAATPDVLEIPQEMSERSTVPVVADVNSDGVPELAVVSWDGFVRVFTGFTPGFSPPMSPFASSDLPTDWPAAHLGMADFDADGVPEIYGGNHIFRFDLTNPNAPKLRRVLTGTQHSGTGYFTTNASVAADLLSVGDCGGDPDCEGLELVAGAYIYSIDLSTTDGDGQQIKVARSLNALEPGQNFTDGYSYVADMNLDGTLDIVTAGRHGSPPKAGFYVWDKNGLLAKFTNPDPHPISDPQFSTIAVANVFDDRAQGFGQDFPEVIYPSRTKISAFNLQAAQATPAAPFWWSVTTMDGSTAAGPTCFDFNGDGFAEIIYRDERFLRLMHGGAAPLPTGVDADRNWAKLTCNSQTIDESPVVADVDNDGEAEIVTLGYLTPFVFGQPDYRGRLLVFESGGLPWSPARAIWNQFNYFGANVNDDLTIPKNQQAHHLEFPALGSGKRPLNLAHAQWPALDENFDPNLPVPDASVSVDSVACAGDSLQVWLTLCNPGSKSLPDSLPISFFKNDPRLPGASLVATVFSETAVSMGSCLRFSVMLPGVFDAPIFAVANDDGQKPLPHPIPIFPLTLLPECDFENNFARLDFPFQSPMLDLGADRFLCGSSVAQLSAGVGFVRYRWQDGSAEPTFTAFGPGKFWVDAWDVCGQKHSDTLAIWPSPTGAIELGSDVVLCAGDSHPLSVAGFQSVKWSPASVLSCADCPATLAAPAATTTIFVTASAGDCFASDSVRVVVVPKPVLSLSVTDGDCQTQAEIRLSVSGAPASEILWSTGETGTSIHPTASGVFSVTVNGSSGCGTTQSAMVSVFGQQMLAATIAQTTHASGPNASDGGATVQVSGGLAPFSFLWSNGSKTQNLANVPPGNYTLTVTDSEGCTQVLEVKIIFEIPPESPRTDCWRSLLFPNPAPLGNEGYLYIQAIGAQVIDLQVFDVSGKWLWGDHLDLPEGISLKKLPPPHAAGAYIVVLSNSCGRGSLKWVVAE
ncbi:MAG: M43 family zinc metalloprotease [Saprospiraceae bacterium]